MSIEAYDAFIRAKQVSAPSLGFEAGEVNPMLFPFQRDVVRWAVRKGRAAIFAAFGLGKTLMQLETLRLVLDREGGRALVIAPLNVRQEFARDAALLGMTVPFVRRIEECEPTGVYLTNYETVRDGKLDPREFTAVSLDEASCLRGLGGTKTFREFMRVLEHGQVKYKFVATATPTPNEFIELLAYSVFLDVMDVGESKTRFFKRDSTKADTLTIHPHKEKEFWLWVSSWAIFILKPSDLCGCTCHREQTSRTSASESWSSPNGNQEQVATEHGSAAATVEERNSFRRQDCSEELSSVADASDHATERNRRQPTERGAACSIESDATGEITGRAALPSASDGEASSPSFPTWGNLRPARPLSDATTTGTTSPKTVAGRPEKTNPETPAVPFESHFSVENNRLRPGLRSSALITGSSTLDTSMGGPSNGCSRISCLQCEQADRGYVLPEIEVHWHELATSHENAGSERDGQLRLVRDSAIGVTSAAREKRDSLEARVAKLMELRALDPSAHRILWHDLEAERAAIERAIPDVRSVYGTQDLDERADTIVAFSDGEIAELAAKPVIAGSGCNLQRHCSWAIYLGIGFKFNDWIQSVHRIHRFLQPGRVRIDMIYTDAEREVRRVLERKWAQHNELVAKMTEIVRTYGLTRNAMAEEIARASSVERREHSGDAWRLVNNDTCRETASMPADSVDLIVTSIPFSMQYEYTPSYFDFGHTDTNEHFFRQMDYLTPQLLRVLRPGRIAAVHVKDRIVPGGMTGLSFQTVYPFHCDTIAHFVRHGFAFLGMKTIVTDVVRENNQTYRLGWTEQCKDGSRMGAGMPEYLLLFRKPPTDRTNGYADVPVVKSKESYTRGRWQLDAHGMMRSSGNRLLSADDLSGIPHERIYKLHRKHSLETVYDYAHHVSLCESLDAKGLLPVTFMLLPPQSWHPDVWTDVTRMRTLNGAQSAAGREMHLCLARDSLVLTRRGYLPIQTVAVGDEVLTHLGRWRRVLVVQCTGVRPVATVTAQGVPGLTLTPDHKLWTRSVRETAWARTHSRREAKAVAPSWVEASRTVGSYVNLKLPPSEPPEITDADYWWTVGRWLADGSMTKHGGAVIACGRHKTDELTRMLGRFGGNPMHDTGTCLQILLRDPGHALRKTLAECGRYAHGKHLPPIAFTLPTEQARALLAGYLSGDGHYRADRRRWMATSASKELLLGIALLAQRVHGTVASVYRGRGPRDCTIEGRVVRAQQEWVLSFDLPDDRRTPQFVLDDGAWKRVRSCEIAGEVETWNLRVEEDESYTAEGCIVKNCPLQFDIVDRAIEQYSMQGETVFDPFSGLGTVPFCAVKLKRRGLGVELNPRYHADAVNYCRAAEREMSTPTLFDLDAGMVREDDEAAS